MWSTRNAFAATDVTSSSFATDAISLDSPTDDEEEAAAEEAEKFPPVYLLLPLLPPPLRRRSFLGATTTRTTGVDGKWAAHFGPGITRGRTAVTHWRSFWSVRMIKRKTLRSGERDLPRLSVCRRKRGGGEVERSPHSPSARTRLLSSPLRS